MRVQAIAVAILSTALSGCSYVYNILAVLRDGRVVFIVDPASSNAPSCVRRVEVSVAGSGERTWRESVDYDDACTNRFPIVYGFGFKGRNQPDWPAIQATALQRGVTYEVSTTTGATGYGSGRFSIREDGRIVNESALSEAEARP
ncbi:MAG: hypothetical protein O9288_04555 [Novosphingobium sp.]|jgi:hypothetical protein|uniref:hypothetical protein n=1 Tax=Novosphingobium sp. TaxID=1874826 RepID=UPI0022BA9D1F|nr:hypothetical protein [Novosphingobium sp.]MCZ8034004.1 hypothetical protein [Novosphingobium sp.]